MPLRLRPRIADAIDEQIWQIYGHRLGGKELEQLAKLFENTELLDRLAGVLWQALDPSRAGRDELKITLAWIDKRPLAKPHGRAQRVELGDAAIFFFDMARSGATVRHGQSRCLILQAKVAKESAQLSMPRVPVNPTRPKSTSSTAREMELLSRWPTFDLYKTSGNRDPVVQAISVGPWVGAPALPPPHGWYMATPKVDAPRPVWQAPWMCAPANDGRLCDVTLGTLLLAFLSSDPFPRAGYPEVGADFNFEPRLLLAPVGYGWDRLCIEILRLCRQNMLPEYLFGSRDRPTCQSITLRSLPYVGDGWGRRFLLGLRDLFFPRRMPVLMIGITRGEGESKGDSPSKD